MLTLACAETEGAEEAREEGVLTLIAMESVCCILKG